MVAVLAVSEFYHGLPELDLTNMPLQKIKGSTDKAVSENYLKGFYKHKLNFCEKNFSKKINHFLDFFYQFNAKLHLKDPVFRPSNRAFLL